MGCCTSKKVYPEPKTSAEPVLTNNDVEIIQKDWKVVEQDPQGNGLLLFRRYAHFSYCEMSQGSCKTSMQDLLIPS